MLGARKVLDFHIKPVDPQTRKIEEAMIEVNKIKDSDKKAKIKAYNNNSWKYWEAMPSIPEEQLEDYKKFLKKEIRKKKNKSEDVDQKGDEN